MEARLVEQVRGVVTEGVISGISLGSRAEVTGGSASRTAVLASRAAELASRAAVLASRAAAGTQAGC